MSVSRLRGADVSTLTEETNRIAGSAGVFAVAVSPDGTRIVSGDSDGNIKLWGERFS